MTTTTRAALSMTTWMAVAAGLASAGCRSSPPVAPEATSAQGGEKPGATEGAASAQPTPQPDVDAPGPAASAEVPPAPNPTTLDGRAPAPPERVAEAAGLVAQGRRLMKRRRHADAVAVFRQARSLDPNSWAAYEQAAAHAASGELDAAFGILGELKKRDCPMCRHWLSLTMRAKTFAKLRLEPRWKALTHELDASGPDYAKLTMDLAQQLLKGDAGGVFGGADHGWSVRVSDKIRAFGAKAEVSSEWYENTAALAAPADLTGRDLSCHPVVGEPKVKRECIELSRPTRARCLNTCCTLVYPHGKYDWRACVAEDGDEFDTSRVHRVCWWPTSSTDAFVTGLSFKRCRHFAYAGTMQKQGYKAEKR